MLVTNREPILIRPGASDDLGAINTIYNRFVVESPVTFDVIPLSMHQRSTWFEQFAENGPHRLLVAARHSSVVGFTCSMKLRPRQAYETSVETTIYLADGASGRGIGTQLYSALFSTLENEDLHRAYAAITLPNAASIGLHEKCGFRAIGTFEEVGRKFGEFWSVGWYEKRLS